VHTFHRDASATLGDDHEARLIIDDDRSIRWVLEKSLTREDIEFKSFATADDALRAAEQRHAASGGQRHPHAGQFRLDFLQVLHQRHPLIPVIVMTGLFRPGERGLGVPGGAFEYLPKPFDINHAIELIRRAIEQSRRKSGDAEQVQVAADILGQAPAMQEVFRAIGRLSHRTRPC